jgi:hypothetical protein
MAPQPHRAGDAGRSRADARQAEALAYWRASRRLVRNDRRLRLSPERADILIIDQALESRWPRFRVAAVATLVLTRKSRAGR